MGEGEQFHLRREQLRKLIERERAILAHRHEAQSRADSFRQELPRHEVAVMLHLGEQNHVACAEKFLAPRLRHEVDALGRPAGEDDFVRARRAEIVGDALSRTLRRPRSRANSARAGRDARWRCRARNSAGAHRSRRAASAIVAALSK